MCNLYMIIHYFIWSYIKLFRSGMLTMIKPFEGNLRREKLALYCVMYLWWGKILRCIAIKITLHGHVPITNDMANASQEMIAMIACKRSGWQAEFNRGTGTTTQQRLAARGGRHKRFGKYTVKKKVTKKKTPDHFFRQKNWAFVV